MTEPALTTYEREKYQEMYASGKYHDVNHGLRLLSEVTRASDAPNLIGKRVLDAGCGTGEAVLALHEAGADAYGFDIAGNCLKPEVVPRTDQFYLGCLWEMPLEIMGHFDYCFCADVMEHIPEEKVGAVFAQLFEACDTLYFRICTREEKFGHRVIGKDLHITVHEFEWWMKAAREAMPTALLAIRHDMEQAKDRFVMVVEHPGKIEYPVFRVNLERLRFRWGHPSQLARREKYGAVWKMYREVEEQLAVNPALAAQIRGGKFLRIFESIARVGPIHPLIIGIEEGPEATHNEYDPIFVVVGGQRLVALRALARSTPMPPWMETWDGFVRVRAKHEEDSWEDDTRAITLHPPLT